jgi:hypothetical protein
MPMMAAPAQMPTAVAAPAPVAEAPKAAAPAAVDTSNLITIKSPMIGTFYRSAGPDKPLFVNIGDGYARTGGKSLGKKQPNALLYATQEGIRGGNNKGVAGIQDKTLLQIPYRFSIGCIDRGWILRNNIIWFKRNAMPESVKDRFTKSHEVIFMFSKNKEYFFDEKFVAQDVWDIPLTPNGTKHIASYNTDLIGRPIVCGCRKGGIVLDMFCGAGTTGIRALELGRNFIGIDGKKEYVDMAQQRINDIVSQPQLF